MKLIRWMDEWITTLRVAPPLSQRRRDLLEAIADAEPENWIEVDRPTDPRLTERAPE